MLITNENLFQCEVLLLFYIFRWLRLTTNDVIAKTKGATYLVLQCIEEGDYFRKKEGARYFWSLKFSLGTVTRIIDPLHEGSVEDGAKRVTPHCLR